MIYLSEFYFPSQNSEANYLAESPRAKMTCYDSFYPFGLFAGRGLKALDLADVTILYGGNGSGKTTALDVYKRQIVILAAGGWAVWQRLRRDWQLCCFVRAAGNLAARWLER